VLTVSMQEQALYWYKVEPVFLQGQGKPPCIGGN